MALAAGRPNWKVHILPGIDHHPLLRVSEVCQRVIASGSALTNPSRGKLPIGVVAEAR